jgi:hypothetical protein
MIMTFSVKKLTVLVGAGAMCPAKIEAEGDQ